jgi:RNA polymerase sigma-70 factor, ECF subfamily
VPVNVDELYRTHGHIVLRRATRLLGNAEDARDVLQQVFVTLVREPERFRGESSFTTYLYRATTNTCLQMLRNGRTRSHLIETRIAPCSSETAPVAELRVIVAELVANLPDAQAFAFIGYYVDGMTHDEIAEQIGCSRRHVGNLVESARRALVGKEEAA